MKKGIEHWCEWEHMGAEETTNVLCIEKKRGKLTLDEIRECCMAHDWNIWLLMIDARGETDEQFCESVPPDGDFVKCINGDNVLICTYEEKRKRGEL